MNRIVAVESQKLQVESILKFIDIRCSTACFEKCDVSRYFQDTQKIIDKIQFGEDSAAAPAATDTTLQIRGNPRCVW